MEGSMTDKHVLFGRTQTNKDINGDKSIINIFHHQNETFGMLVNSLTQNSTVQACRDAGKCVPQKQELVL